jgi:hypothetical protein
MHEKKPKNQKKQKKNKAPRQNVFFQKTQLNPHSKKTFGQPCFLRIPAPCLPHDTFADRQSRLGTGRCVQIGHWDREYCDQTVRYFSMLKAKLLD